MLMLSCLPVILVGQTTSLRFDRIGVEEGLPNMSVAAVHQDRFGFIWVGTWDGLCRYDGQSFEVFRTRPGDTTSLLFNEIKDFAETNDSSFWVATYGGLTKLDLTTGKFLKRADNRSKVPSHPRLVHFTVANQKGGMVLTGHRGNQLHVSQNDTSSYRVSLHHFPANLSAMVPLPTEDGIWVGTDHGLAFIDHGSDSAQFAREVDPILRALEGRHIEALHQDETGVVWIGTLSGLWGYSPHTSTLQEVTFTDGRPIRNVQVLAEGKGGQLWIGTKQGLFRRYALSGQIDSYFHDPLDPFSISHDDIQAILVDESETLWIGTARGGLNRANLRSPSSFRAITHSAFNLPRHELVVFSFAEADPKSYWVGTNHGLFLMDRATHEVQGHWLSDRTIMSVYQTSNGETFLSTRPGGFYQFLRDENPFLSLPIQDTSLQKEIFFRTIRAESSSEDSLLLAGNFGVWRYTRSQQSWTRLTTNYSWDLLSLNDCQILIAENGISTFDVCLDTMASYRDIASQQDFLKANTVLLQDQDQVWIGTYGMGLLSRNLTTGAFTRWSRAQGLPSDYVFGMLEDHRGGIWLSTTEGLARLDKSTGAILSFNQEDGLIDNEFGTNSFMKTSEGEMFFGGNNGYISFYPEEVEVRQSQFRPPLRITSLMLSGDPVQLKKAPWITKEIEYPGYQQQHLEIQFAALDFSRPKNLSYQHRLIGWNEEWTRPSASSSAHFSNLRPGQYEFQVRSTNGDGKWSQEIVSLNIRIRPLWYQTWWVRIAGPLCGLALVMGAIFFRFRQSRQREREALYYRIAHTKQEALSAQMDHHFTFNSLNSIQRFISENDKTSSLTYISRFGKLIRRFLDQARKNEHPIEDEITTLELYLSLEALRAKHQFTYRFEVDPGIDPFNTDIPTSLLQPLVENAIWHGLVPRKDQEGELVVRFSLTETNLLLIVEDNGIGRKRSKRFHQRHHQSKGMTIIRERLEALELLSGQSLSLKFEELTPGAQTPGTRAMIYLPLPE